MVANAEPLNTAFSFPVIATDADNEPLRVALFAAVVAKLSAFDWAADADSEPLNTASWFPTIAVSALSSANDADWAALDADVAPAANEPEISAPNDAVAICRFVVCNSKDCVASCKDDVANANSCEKFVGSPNPAIVDDWIFVLAICTTPPSTLKISPASAIPLFFTLIDASSPNAWLPFVNGTLCTTLIGMKLLLIS